MQHDETCRRLDRERYGTPDPAEMPDEFRLPAEWLEERRMRQEQVVYLDGELARRENELAELRRARPDPAHRDCVFFGLGILAALAAVVIGRMV